MTAPQKHEAAFHARAADHDLHRRKTLGEIERSATSVRIDRCRSIKNETSEATKKNGA